MRTLIIDNYDSFTHNLAHYVAEVSGVEPTIVKNDEPGWTPDRLRSFDNIVISPGPGTPRRDTDFGICADVIRETRLPLLGVCLGHQGICHLFGGRVGPAPEVRHGRPSLVRHTGEDLFRGLPSPFSAIRYHSLAAWDLPPSLEATAWSEDGTLMGVRHRERPLWGVQFHPESVRTEHGHQLIRNFMELTRESGTTRAAYVAAPASAVAAAKPPTHRVLARTVSSPVPAEVVFDRLFSTARHAFWLDSSRTGEHGGRFSYMGDASGPLARVVTADVWRTRVTVESADGAEHLTGQGFFDWLEADLAAHRTEVPDLPFDFALGWVGYLGYELKAECGGVRAHRSRHPDAAMVFADRALAFDHRDGTIRLLALHPVDDDAAAVAWLDDTVRRLAALAREAPVLPEPRSPGTTELGPLSLRHGRRRYLDLIKACQDEITAGETYEVCLTNMITVPGAPAPWPAYRRLRQQNPVPYAAYLSFGDLAVLSSSPERFLRISADGTVESKPIKGTRPRSADPAEDARLRDGLAASEKDRAENLMIVDLVRNDLATVSRPGSVEVDPIFAVESYATVHQLVSTVRARLLPDSTAVSCVRAAFPGGSMTGAPKIRTMEIIDRLEDGPRGVYSGAVGYFSLSGAADLSIVIRTAVISPDRVEFGVGGAIIALSDPVEEFQETAVKAAPLLRLIDAAFPAESTTPAKAGALR